MLFLYYAKIMKDKNTNNGLVIVHTRGTYYGLNYWLMKFMFTFHLLLKIKFELMRFFFQVLTWVPVYLCFGNRFSSECLVFVMTLFRICCSFFIWNELEFRYQHSALWWLLAFDMDDGSWIKKLYNFKFYLKNASNFLSSCCNFILWSLSIWYSSRGWFWKNEIC